MTDAPSERDRLLAEIHALRDSLATERQLLHAAMEAKRPQGRESAACFKCGGNHAEHNCGDDLM